MVTSSRAFGGSVYDLRDAEECLTAGAFSGPLTRARCGSGELGGTAFRPSCTGVADIVVIRANVRFRMYTCPRCVLGAL